MRTPYHNKSIVFFLLTITVLVVSCKTGTVNLFKPASPHEQYQRKLVTSGLDKTAMGMAWIAASVNSISNAPTVALPFREKGYFAAERIPAAAYNFKAKKGQKIMVTLAQKPVEQFKIYVDLIRQDQNKLKLLAFADTLKNTLVYEIEDSGDYLLRIQPELLGSGEYTLDINYGPSLDYPVRSTSKNLIQSYFGDGRDANSRKHEGIDLFAPRLTPVIAAANGVVTRVNENNLGGKVVWMRPSGKNYTLYYAHLDVQVAKEGQQVSIGDTLGLMGNTGNAKTTAPHLHFGIYGLAGAVDPLPFVDPVIKSLPEVTVPLSNLNATMRTNTKTVVYRSPETASAQVYSLPQNTIVKVTSAYKNWYKVMLQHDSSEVFVQGSKLSTTLKPIRSIRVKLSQLSAYDKPDSLAATKITLIKNAQVDVLGFSGDYQLIKDAYNQTGWLKP
ncbi:MAG: M23 family metallopeptidase [Bacteroidota bacterium]